MQGDVPRRVKPVWYAMVTCPAREIQTGIGPVTVQIPKVRSKMGERGHVSVCPGTTVCEKDEITGSGPAVVIFERDIDGGDA